MDYQPVMADMCVKREGGVMEKRRCRGRYRREMKVFSEGKEGNWCVEVKLNEP